ncbi:MAG: C-GCAxxG-C-C family protein [Lachnospiraceae bacterium]|nr:C-GCAxxG-C-C family protein [Lachnospiraceae bacterium]
MERKELAVELKHNGYNCAQAVLCAFKDELGMNEDTLKKMGAGFGVGMGTLESTCGALCAAQMVLGIKEYEGKPILRDAAEVLKNFEDKCGATICKDLKGRDTGVVVCECDDCVRNAVEVIGDKLGL